MSNLQKHLKPSRYFNRAETIIRLFSSLNREMLQTCKESGNVVPVVNTVNKTIYNLNNKHGCLQQRERSYWTDLEHSSVEEGEAFIKHGNGLILLQLQRPLKVLHGCHVILSVGAQHGIRAWDQKDTDLQILLIYLTAGPLKWRAEFLCVCRDEPTAAAGWLLSNRSELHWSDPEETESEDRDIQMITSLSQQSSLEECSDNFNCYSALSGLMRAS